MKVNTFEQTDGYLSHYRLWRVPHAHDIIVLLHGGMSHSGWQAPLGDALMARSDISFAAVDRRGSGMNDCRGHIPSSAGAVSDVAEFLRYVKSSYERVHLAGWCFGAQVAAAVAASVSAERLISSLLFVAPGFFFNQRYSDVLSRSIESAVAAVEELHLRPAENRAYIKVPLQAADFTTRPEWQAFIDDDDLRLTMVTEGTVRAWDELAQLAERRFADIGDIPVLAVFGRQDQLVDNAQVQEFLTSRRPVTIEEVDTGHAVQFEDADKLAGLMASFVTLQR